MLAWKILRAPKSETIYQLPITQRYCLRREEPKNIIDNYIICYTSERALAKLSYLVEFRLKNYHQTVTIPKIGQP